MATIPKTLLLELLCKKYDKHVTRNDLISLKPEQKPK